MENMQEIIDAVMILVSTLGVQVLGAIVLLIVGLFAAGMVRGGVRKGLNRAGIDETLVPFLSKGAYYLSTGGSYYCCAAAFWSTDSFSHCRSRCCGSSSGARPTGNLVEFCGRGHAAYF